MFDIIGFLEEYKVEYKTEGNNVSDGWVNINCPFCKDPSFHMGFPLEGGRVVSCWRCGKNDFEALIRELDVDEIGKIFRKYGDREVSDIPEKEKVIEKKIALPKYIQPLSNLPEHKKYLKNRGFDPLKIKQDWGIWGTSFEDEDYMHRIIIPVFSKGQLVSFQGRDITGKQKTKYKSCEGTNIKDYLYGLDYMKNNFIIIVEGALDVWRLGKGIAVATFGIQFTMKQIRLLVEWKFQKVLILFDHGVEAQEQAGKLKNSLEMFDINCLNVLPPKGRDAAQMNPKEIRNILSMLQEK